MSQFPLDPPSARGSSLEGFVILHLGTGFLLPSRPLAWGRRWLFPFCQEQHGTARGRNDWGLSDSFGSCRGHQG